jgi:NOL1/NOP2/sun family putative RNA methylase
MNIDAIETNLPQEFVTRLQALFPQDRFSSVLSSFKTQKPLAIRLNTIKSGTEEFFTALTQVGINPQKLDWYKNAFLLPASVREQITHSAMYEAGKIYVQNPSSMLPALVLSPQQGEEILDLAAAPGSKTLQMACMMQNNGRIAAVEKVKKRFYKLKANVQHQGATIVQCYLTDGSLVWRKVPERFDKVLLDAPCSSESRFTEGDPSTYAHWSLRKIHETAHKQKRLIYSAIQCLKPGGILVYATCSFAPEENEAILNYALDQFGESIEIEPIDLPIENYLPGITKWQEHSYNSTVKNAVRIIPNDIMDGFFMCRIRKNSTTCELARTRHKGQDSRYKKKRTSK